ncbi:hypothetical protein [Paracoccus sp. (in: a-proteobacteria)]|uniref:hypothetical protein n=1 Tax=Paracoccus sp. TaxID=267 RepID=UPI00396C8EB8
MTDYQYRAVRKSDGQEIDHGWIEDYLDMGPEVTATTLRSGLISSHPQAEDLTQDDIYVEMQKARQAG